MTFGIIHRRLGAVSSIIADSHCPVFSYSCFLPVVSILLAYFLVLATETCIQARSHTLVGLLLLNSSLSMSPFVCFIYRDILCGIVQFFLQFLACNFSQAAQQCCLIQASSQNFCYGLNFSHYCFNQLPNMKLTNGIGCTELIDKYLQTKEQIYVNICCTHH